MTPLQIVTVLVAMLSFGVYVQQELGIHTNGPKFGRMMHAKEIVQAPDDGQFICHSFIQSDKFHFISFHAPVWWKVKTCVPEAKAAFQREQCCQAVGTK